MAHTALTPCCHTPARRLIRSLLPGLLLCLLAGTAPAAARETAALTVPAPAQPREESTDSLTAAPATPAAPADSIAPARPKPRSSTYWIKQLFQNGFLINDPAVEYPRFPRFALKVYNWGNDVFNTYDTTYVVGTGKNWKLQAKSFNWIENITMRYPHNHVLSMRTHFYADAGPSISFMAVSLGYMFNVNDLIGSPTHRSTFSFDFTCSRFAINLMAQSFKGDMIITRLPHADGDYKGVQIPFENGDVSSLYLDAYYFFNNRRYSQAAAYAFSKYQLRSAGTWIAGFTYSTKSIKLNLAGIALPQEIKVQSGELRDYYFHYSDYQLLAGYGYNWAFVPRRWVLNATCMLSVGYRRSYEDATEGKRDMIANGFRVNVGSTYNHRALFVALSSTLRGGLFYTSQFAFFNANFNVALNVGMRF